MGVGNEHRNSDDELGFDSHPGLKNVRTEIWVAYESKSVGC